MPHSQLGVVEARHLGADNANTAAQNWYHNTRVEEVLESDSKSNFGQVSSIANRLIN